MGRWIGRLMILLLVLAACWAFFAYFGGPREMQVIEVDVTDAVGKLTPQ
jgi:hypothetical protein